MVNLEEWTTMEGATMFPCLEELRIFYCPQLRSVQLTGPCLSLKELHIYMCEELRRIGDGLSSTDTCLKEMKLEHCPNLSWIPFLEGFSSLQNLRIDGCEKLEVVPIEGNCSSLENLSISNCKQLRKIGDGFSTATCLKELSLEFCPNLSSIPDLEGCSLQILDVTYCYKLERISLKAPLSSLKQLRINDCRNLKPINLGIDGVSSLTELDFTRVGDELSCLLPSLLVSNTSLCNLTIYGLPHLISFPDNSLTSLNCLGELTIGGNFWEELEEFPGLNSIQHLSASLRVLELRGWEKLKSLPHQIQFLTALEELRIDSFDGIEALPEWLGYLSSLRSLGIWRCDNLMYLPSVDVMQSLSNLKQFWIYGCPQLRYHGFRNPYLCFFYKFEGEDLSFSFAKPVPPFIENREEE